MGVLHYEPWPYCQNDLKMHQTPTRRANGAKLYFYWPYMIVSMIWNTYKILALHLNRATAIFVVDWCQFGPSWIFGLKMELMSCAGLVGGRTLKSWIFLTSYDSTNDMKYFRNCLHHTSPVIQPFLLLIGANLTQAGVWAENGAYVLYWLC